MAKSFAQFVAGMAESIASTHAFPVQQRARVDAGNSSWSPACNLNNG